MHLFTVIQVLLLALMFGLKLSSAAIAFPLFVILLIPVRLRIMNYFFSEHELEEVSALCNTCTVRFYNQWMYEEVF